MISIVPLVILVVICKAWKKLVFSGPMLVTWAGKVTSHGAIAPALAGAATFISDKPVRYIKIGYL